MHYYKYLGTPEQAKELWENRESLEKYLSRLKELMEEDEGLNSEQNVQVSDTIEADSSNVADNQNNQPQ
jgi:hypothetical protein